MSVRKTNNLQSTSHRKGSNKQDQTLLLINVLGGKGGVYYPLIEKIHETIPPKSLLVHHPIIDLNTTTIQTSSDILAESKLQFNNMTIYIK